MFGHSAGYASLSHRDPSLLGTIWSLPRAPAAHVLGTRAESGVPREPSRAGKGAAPETQLNFLHPTRASAHRPVPQRLQDHLFGRISNPKWTPFLCRVFHPNDCRSRSTCVSTGRFASALVEVLELFRRGDFGTGRCAVTKRVAWSRRVIWQASADEHQTFRRRCRRLFEGKRKKKLYCINIGQSRFNLMTETRVDNHLLHPNNR